MGRAVLVAVSTGFMLFSPVLIAAQEPTPTCETTPGCLTAYIEALQHTRAQLEKEVIRLRHELAKVHAAQPSPEAKKSESKGSVTP